MGLLYRWVGPLVMGLVVGCASADGGSSDRNLDLDNAGGTDASPLDTPSPAAPIDDPSAVPSVPRPPLSPPPPSPPGTIGDGEACNADSYQAEPRQLDIYMVVDDSGSMVPWWPGTLDAINMFFDAPSSAGIGVGVQFFGSNCDANYYATPRVPIAPLPGNADPLRLAFPPLPIEGTATVPAAEGAMQHARQWAMDHPDSKPVVLLITDGLPDDCGSTVQGVVQALADGLGGTPSIQTFVVGIGVQLDALNMFAQAGGTGQAILVSPGAADELLQALSEIRQAALPCDYKIPDGAQGDIANDTINLRYTAPGGQQETIGYVPEVALCDPQVGGWFYDDPSAPTRVVACPGTCDALSGGGEVQVVLGCPRVNAVPF